MLTSRTKTSTLSMNFLHRWLLHRNVAETLTKKKKKKLREDFTYFGSSSGSLPEGAKQVTASHSNLCEARETLGLATQELGP